MEENGWLYVQQLELILGGNVVPFLVVANLVTMEREYWMREFCVCFSLARGACLRRNGVFRRAYLWVDGEMCNEMGGITDILSSLSVALTDESFHLCS